MSAVMRKLFNQNNETVIASDLEASSESEWEEDIDENSLLKDRPEFFITSFLEYWEQKFKEYKDIADVDGVAKEIKFMGQNVPKVSKTSSIPSSIFAFIPLLLKYVYILFAYIMQFILGKKHRNRAKKLVNIFQNIPDQERRAVFAETGADIYYSFQYQLNQIADVNGYWKRGLRKVAKDARDRAMRYLAKQDCNSIGAITPEILTRAVLLGTPKSMYGHTIKLARSEEELKTSDLFGVLGLKVKYGDVGTAYYYKVTLDGHVGSSACEYRFALDWEKKGRWEQNYKKVETAVRSLDASEMRERSFLEAIVQKVLQKFKDSASQQEEITAGVERIEGSLNKIDTGVDHIQRDVNQIGTGVDRIESGVNQAVCEVGRMAEGAYLIALEMNRIREIVNHFLDQGQNKDDQNKTPLTNFWYNFKRSVANFIGRERELQTLHYLLTESPQNVVITQCAIITGLGGIGKTNLARMYALIYEKQSYDGNIIWIDSGTESSRKESFEKLAEKLGIPFQKPTENQEKHSEIELLEKVYERISFSKCLIIYDNVEKYEDIKQYLIKSSTVKKTRPTILITSRRDNWAVRDEGFIKPLPLDMFTNDEAICFVKKMLEIPETETFCDEKIDELTELLSCFPVAPETAVGFFKSSRIKVTKENLSERIDEYIQLYRTYAEKSLNYSSNLDRYKKRVYNTWRITSNRIKMNKKYGKDAIDLMEKIAYCFPDNIDFYVGMKLEHRGDTGESRKRSEIWLLLKRYSLISIDGDKLWEGASVHRLVQEVVRFWIRKEGREERVLRNFLKGFDEELRFWSGDVWNYASEYSSLLDEYVLNNELLSLIRKLAIFGKHEALDNIIRRLEDLENMNMNLDWKKLLKNGKISDHMIRNSKYFNELARNLCIFDAYFQRKLLPADSMTKFDNFFENFSKRFDKKILLETWYDSDKPPLLFAIWNGDMKLVEWLLNKGAKRMALSREGDTAMHYAAEFRRHEAGDVMTLLAPSADECNYRNRRGETPLHLAVEEGNLDGIKFLLKNGADPTIVDNDGRNAIHWAVECGYFKLLQLFSLNAEKCNIQTNNGETLLHLVFNSHYRFLREQGEPTRVFKFLLEKGADPLICDREGRNAIWYAIQNEHTEAVRFFIERDILTSSTRFKNERSPLHVAVASGNIDMIEIFLKMGIDVNCTDDDGNRPLHLVFKRSCEWYEDPLYRLYRICSCIESVDSVQLECQHFQVANFLIDSGAEVNCANNDGVKLIHLASKHNHLSIMKLCNDSGCNYESTTNNGTTPPDPTPHNGLVKS